jgi:hypothetical protein
MPFKPRRASIIEAAGSPTRMKTALEALSETFAAGAAILWFLSARVRLRTPNRAKRCLETGLEDPRLLLRLVYEQSQWSAWAAIAAGLAAIFAIADGLVR